MIFMISRFVNYDTKIQVAILIAIICIILIVRILLSRGLNNLFKISSDSLKQLKHKNKVINHLTLSIIFYGLYQLLVHSNIYQRNTWMVFVSKTLLIFLVITLSQIVIQLLKLTHEFFGKFEISKKQSIKPLIQVAQLVVSIVMVLIIIAIITENNPITLIAGASAVTAILGLIFKDMILSFFAGMYLSATKIIQLGDFISIQDMNAMGTVEEIGMSHVTLRNTNNSTTILPSSVILQKDIVSYSTIVGEDGRRIEKTLLIDPQKIKTLNPTKREMYLNKYQLREDAILNTNVDLLTETITQYMLRHASINSDKSVLAMLGNQSWQGLELNIIASTYISDYAEFNNFQSRLTSMIVFYINHFELQKD